MNTVPEIEAAIQALPASERERLAEDMLSILPELRGDLIWQHLLNDERPRASLSSLGDRIETGFKTSPHQFPEINDSDFEKRA